MNFNSLVWYSSLAIGDEKNSYVANFLNKSCDLLNEEINEEIKDKKILEKIILCDVQKKIYLNLEKAFLNLIHNSGYPEVKMEKKVDFDKLYNSRFN